MKSIKQKVNQEKQVLLSGTEVKYWLKIIYKYYFVFNNVKLWKASTFALLQSFLFNANNQYVKCLSASLIRFIKQL